MQNEAIAIGEEIGGSGYRYFDRMPVRGLHAGLFFLIMFAYFFQQFNNWNFSFIAPALEKSWGLKPADMARIVFWYMLGMTAGAFLTGFISDRIGRRPTFLAAIIIFSVSSAVTAFTSNLTVFTVFRALTGFGIFAMMVVSNAYIAEVAPAESRGKWQSLVAAVGFCAAPAVALVSRLVVPLGPEAWRYVFCFGALGFIPFIWGIFFLRESPRWLVSRGRVKEAEEVVWSLTGNYTDLSAAAASEKQASAAEQIFGMFSGRYILRTLVIFLLFVCVTPASFLIVVWTARLLNMQGFDPKAVLNAMVIISLGVPAGLFLNAWITDKGGRKLPMAVAALLSAGVALVFGKMTNLAALTAVGFLLNACYMALCFSLFSYVAESYPTRMRNTAVGIHQGLSRISVSVSQPYIPLISNTYGFYGIFVAVAALFALPVIPLLLLGQKTGGRSLEDLE